MTKVTFVIQDLFSLGAQYVTALIIRGFIAKGYDVDLIVSQIQTAWYHLLFIDLIHQESRVM